jgi:hypothetical protein
MGTAHLRAVVCHRGGVSAQSGHYYTICQVLHPVLKTECWAKVDDLAGQYIEFLTDDWMDNPVVQSSVYLLFYDRVPEHDWDGVVTQQGSAAGAGTSRYVIGMASLNDLITQDVLCSPESQDDVYEYMLRKVEEAGFSSTEMEHLISTEDGNTFNDIHVAIATVRGSVSSVPHTVGKRDAAEVLHYLRS